MRRRVRSLLLLMLVGWSFPAQARGQAEDPSSSEGALFLLLPAGARGVALGRAMTAMPGAEGVFWNPAALADVKESGAVLLRGDHAVGTATALSVLLAGADRGTLGLSYLLLNVGDQDLTDGEGNILGTVSVRNHLGVASVAARLWNRLDAGLNFKVIQFRLSCRGTLCPDGGTTATTYAVDAGLQLQPGSGLPLRLGAMVAHAGPRLQVLNADQADPLPARIRVGAALDLVRTFLPEAPVGGWLSVEVQDRLRDLGSLSLYLGSELTAGDDDALFLRAGYVVGDLDQEDGARVGLGLRYERFDLAIAKSLAVSTLSGEGEPIHVTLSILFG